MAPTTPVEGPDSTVRTGSVAAVVHEMDAAIRLGDVGRNGDGQLTDTVFPGGAHRLP